MPAMFLAGPQRWQVSHLRTVICQMFRPEDATSLPAWPSPPLPFLAAGWQGTRAAQASIPIPISPPHPCRPRKRGIPQNTDYRIITEYTVQVQEARTGVELWHFLALPSIRRHDLLCNAADDVNAVGDTDVVDEADAVDKVHTTARRRCCSASATDYRTPQVFRCPTARRSRPACASGSSRCAEATWQPPVVSVPSPD